MAEDRDSDIFPWLPGAVLLLGAAAAVVGVYRSNVAAPVATVESPQVQAPVAAPSSSIAASATPVPAGPTHHVWECELGGQRIYTDQRCGDASSLREIGEPNRMPAEPGRVDGEEGYDAGDSRANAGPTASRRRCAPPR
jgi:hypothetical protein